MGVNPMDITSSSDQENCDCGTDVDHKTMLIPRTSRSDVGDHSGGNQSELIEAQDENHGTLSDEQDGGFYCPLSHCRKYFPSKKALHGHMRSHPDRGWRGMAGPSGGEGHTDFKKSKKNGKKFNKCRRNSASSDETNAMNWKVKARRGRKGKMPLYNTNLEKTDPIYIAGCRLMCSRYGYHFSSSSSGEDSGRSSGSYENIPLRDLAKARLDRETEEMQIDDEKDNDALGTSSSKSGLKQKSKSVKQSNRSYHCQICNKSFATHQALGGHTASHNKGKDISSEANCDNNLALEDQRKEENYPRVSTETVAKEHKCKVCEAVYPTGQALGGHMRMHYHPSSSPEEQQLIVHNFDLNEPPSPECGEEA